MMVCAGNSNLAWSSSVIFQLQAKGEKAKRLQVPAGLQSWEKSATQWRIGAITLIIIPRKGIILLIVWCRDGFPGVLGGNQERLPWGLRWQRIFLQCRRPGFYPWVGRIQWRREWLPIPVFLPGKFHEQRSLVGCSPWGHKESHTTEQLTCTRTASTESWVIGSIGHMVYYQENPNKMQYPGHKMLLPVNDNYTAVPYTST